MARRGENIYKRKDGRWEGRVVNGYGKNGKKKYRSVYAGSYAELKTKMRKMGDDKKAVENKPVLLMQDACRLWLEEKQYVWKPSTYSCYLRLMENHIIPAIGKVPMEQFNNSYLNQFIQHKKTDAGLSDSYIRDMASLIIQALRYLKETYEYPVIIPSVMPKRQDSKGRALPNRSIMTNLERYLIEHASDSTCLGILIGCYTGIRIGELCALQWREIDIDNEVIHIRKTMQRVTVFEGNESKSKIMVTFPKTNRSIRDIPIPPIILDILKKYRRDDDDYIICGSKIEYAEPRTVQYRFRSILKRCKIDPFNFHMLRHVFATRCISLGFDLNSLSELLGHSSVQVTLNRYVHSSNGRKKSLMSQFQL